MPCIRTAEQPIQMMYIHMDFYASSKWITHTWFTGPRKQPFMRRWTYVPYTRLTSWKDSHWQYEWIYHGNQVHDRLRGIQTLEMPGFVTVNTYESKTERPQRDLIHCRQQQWQGRQGGRTNIQWKHDTTYLIWHFLATLAAYIFFLHRKQLLSLIIPREQSRRQWWDLRYHGDSSDTNVHYLLRSGETYDTTGTVVTQTYFSSNDTTVTVGTRIPREQSRRQWDKQNIPNTTGTVTRTVVRQTKHSDLRHIKVYVDDKVIMTVKVYVDDKVYADDDNTWEQPRRDCVNIYWKDHIWQVENENIHTTGN